MQAQYISLDVKFEIELVQVTFNHSHPHHSVVNPCREWGAQNSKNISANLCRTRQIVHREATNVSCKLRSKHLFMLTKLEKKSIHIFSIAIPLIHYKTLQQIKSPYHTC